MTNNAKTISRRLTLEPRTGGMSCDYPSKPPIPIGNSRSVAEHRLSALKRQLNFSPELKREYSAFLREYEQLHHMRPVPAIVPPDEQVVYIPHHAVTRASSSTTKLSVVFDASSITTNGTSLNSHLLTGPKLQTDLISVLMRWRQHNTSRQQTSRCTDRF